MRKTTCLAGMAAALALAPLAAAAQSSNLTEFFSTSDLVKLAGSAEVLNLEAQSADGKAQNDVNAFNDYFLINGTGKRVVNFDASLTSKGAVAIAGWVGVARYSNHAISADIQKGFETVKAKYSLTNAAGNVVVYKTLNTGELIYDYAVELAPASTRCQEYLYAPASGTMQLGMQVNCRWSLKNFAPGLKRSGGRLGAAKKPM